jgi:hypothetical protein
MVPWRVVALVALVALYDGYSRYNSKDKEGGAEATNLAQGGPGG